MTSARQTPLTCPGHTRPVVHLDFSEKTEFGYFLISACKDGKPMLRQGETGDWIGTFEGHKGAVWGACLNNEATRAATGAADFSAKLWDTVSGEQLHEFTHKHIVKAVEFSPDSNHLLTGSNEKILRIFDLQRPDAEPTCITGHEGSIRYVSWLRDRKQFITAAEDKTVRIWDAANATEIKRLQFDSIALGMDISHDGTTMVIASGNTVSFWDSQSFEKQKSFEVPTPVYSACLHNSKDFFVAGGEDFKLYKFSYADGSELESYKGHFGPVHCVRFSPDGEIYASGSEDGTLRLWQTTVGKTYGLWKWEDPTEDGTKEDGKLSSMAESSSPQVVNAQA
ncbi:serine-threonine kinase receptor-associated protein-like [Apostichopus japonicus]|uniref:serine-threonine kinase receptor-associated protein-like n=1 Tax=Stichopus japonicus TaxID=307972 RepID=UPI003AB81C20